MFTRRQILKGAAALTASGFGLGGYAFAIEPYRLKTVSYRLNPPGWPNSRPLRIVALADLHICEPWMPTSRVEAIVDAANQLAPDLVVLLGDFVAGHRLVRAAVPKAEWTRALARLRAPLGTYAVLGNHDWWESYGVQVARAGPTPVGQALEAAGIPVLENDAVRVGKGEAAFWLLGLGDQWAFFLNRRRRSKNGRFGFAGTDDLPATLAKIKDDQPAILLAHEPDIFPKVPSRVALTLSGHTHGGQVQFFGYAPRVPSFYGRRYMYGHVSELDAGGGERSLVISGGLGCSGLPIRFGRPPEITVVELGTVSA